MSNAIESRKGWDEFCVDSMCKLSKFNIKAGLIPGKRDLCARAQQTVHKVLKPTYSLIWGDDVQAVSPDVYSASGLEKAEQLALAKQVDLHLTEVLNAARGVNSRRRPQITIRDINLPNFEQSKCVASANVGDGKMLKLLIGVANTCQQTRKTDRALLYGVMEILVANWEQRKQQKWLSKKTIQSDLKKLRKRKKEIAKLSSNLIRAQEENRQQIAAELHDSVGQALTVIKIQSEFLRNRVHNDLGDKYQDQFESILEKAKLAIEEVRRIAMDLRPIVLDDLGIIATIEWFCRECAKIFPNMEILRNIDVQEDDIDEDLKVTVFRIIQEAFNNTIRHAEATDFEITLIKTCARLVLVLKDNGKGFETAKEFKRHNSFGIRSMRRRAQLTNGDFRIESHVGRGTQIEVAWSMSR